jgi:hypothetical protein
MSKATYLNKVFFMPSLPCGEGEGEGDEVTKEKFDALQAKLNEATSSIEKLTNKSKTILTEKKALEEKINAWGDLDPENVRNLLEKFDQDEELKLIAEGKHTEVIQKRVEKVEAGYKSKITQLEEELGGLKQYKESTDGRIRDLMVDSNVITAFIEEKGLDSAIPDIRYRARGVWSIEGDELVARDNKGEIIPGKNGPLTPKEWVDTLKEGAPHLFPPSEGAGGQGSSGGRPGGIDAKMAAAASRGDMKEYRRLRAEKAKAAEK